MKIFKDTYAGFNSASKIQAEIDKAINERERRNNGENFPFSAQLWAVQIAKGQDWEYIAKTEEQFEEEQGEQARIEAEIERNTLLVSAQTDEGVNDQVVSDYMTEHGFPEWKLAFMQSRLGLEEITQEKFDEFQANRLAKKQEIVDEINSATA